jgi:hypothetical protein
MAGDLLKILDRCEERIRRGETGEQCLADYPRRRAELEPLLKTVHKLRNAPRTSPAEEFCRTSPDRLMARIRAESARVGPEKKFSPSGWRQGLAFKTLVPAALVVLIALAVWFTRPLSPSPVAAEDLTLSLLSGSTEVQAPGSSDWRTGTDGMSLKTGSRIRAGAESSATLTFFDGTSTTLEAGAVVRVSRSEYLNQRSMTIELDQESGRTWSFVRSGGDEQPYFEIRTPQGTALARGTAFSVEVENTGYTRFAVTEGAIQVREGDREMVVEAEQQVRIGDPAVPAAPQPLPPAESELIVSTGQEGAGAIRDPGGASTGYYPDGIAFNQIMGSKIVLSAEGQRILLQDPESGIYLLTCRTDSHSAVPVDIRLQQNGQTVFEHTETLPATATSGWIIEIKLTSAGQGTFKGDILSIQPLSGPAPENVVVPEMAKKKAAPPASVISPASSAAPETAPAAIPPDGPTAAPAGSQNNGPAETGPGRDTNPSPATTAPPVPPASANNPAPVNPITPAQPVPEKTVAPASSPSNPPPTTSPPSIAPPAPPSKTSPNTQASPPAPTTRPANNPGTPKPTSGKKN